MLSIQHKAKLFSKDLNLIKAGEIIFKILPVSKHLLKLKVQVYTNHQIENYFSTMTSFVFYIKKYRKKQHCVHLFLWLLKDEPNCDFKYCD